MGDRYEAALLSGRIKTAIDELKEIASSAAKEALEKEVPFSGYKPRYKTVVSQQEKKGLFRRKTIEYVVDVAYPTEEGFWCLDEDIISVTVGAYATEQVIKVRLVLHSDGRISTLDDQDADFLGILEEFLMQLNNEQAETTPETEQDTSGEARAPLNPEDVLVALRESVESIPHRDSVPPTDEDGNELKIRFDGLYITRGAGTSYTYFLRFFENGAVANTASVPPGQPKEVIKWLTEESEDGNHGVYAVDGNKIIFKLASKRGIVEYDGTILANGLQLTSLSRINNKQNKKKYEFSELSADPNVFIETNGLDGSEDPELLEKAKGSTETDEPEKPVEE